jgi:hypothetical protein
MSKGNFAMAMAVLGGWIIGTLIVLRTLGLA